MKADDKGSKKDLKANPDSSINPRPTTGERFPESRQAHDAMEMRRRQNEGHTTSEKKEDDFIELLNDVTGTTTEPTDPRDMAGVRDVSGGLRPRRKRR